MTSRSGIDKAVQAVHRARRVRAQRPADPFYAALNRLEAEEAEAEAAKLMRRPDHLRRGCGEDMRLPSPEQIVSETANSILGALENPTITSVEASEQRMEDAAHLGLLAAALDASVTAGAR